MANVLGFAELVESRKTLSDMSKYLLKGVDGEIRAVEYFNENLEDDITIVCHPQIGNLDPDIIIYIPGYGFRIVEVKNWNLTNVSSYEYNGLAKVNESTSNPINQVKKHLEVFNQYLQTSHKEDQYKSIGYFVFHIGFTENEFHDKFMRSWDKKSKDDFIKHYLFSNSNKNDLKDKLIKCSKYPAKQLTSFMDEKNISLLKSMSISDFKLSEIELLIEATNVNKDQFDALVLKSNNSEILYVKSEQKLDEIINHIKTEKDDRLIKNKKNRFVKLILLAFLIFIFMALFYYGGQMIKSDRSNSEISLNSNDEVSISVKVEKFAFDKNSKTKFLECEYDGQLIKLVIFSDVKTPFVKIGNTYEITGKVQIYKEELQILVYSIK